MSPWKEIWIHPRNAIEWIVHNTRDRLVLFFATVAGLYFFVNFFSSLRAPGFTGPGGTVLIAVMVVVSPFLGMFYFWINSYLLKWVGSWFKGTGERLALRSALAWSYVPVFFLLLLFLLNQIIARVFIYQETIQHLPLPAIIASYPIWLTLNSLITLILGVWSLVIYVSCIAQVHKFGWVKAIATAIVTAIFWWVALSIVISLLTVVICMFGVC